MRILQDHSASGTAHPADRFHSSRAARLRYRDEGCGPALVLIHGWALDLEVWEPQVTALAGCFRILRWDRRGFGHSTGRPSLEADVRDLHALLDRAGIERAAILGMSQGARVALRFATTAPDRTRCLVLDGAPADARLAEGEWTEEIPFEHYRDLLRSGGIEALRGALARHPLMRLRTRDPHMRRLLGAVLRRYGAADLGTSGSRSARLGPQQLRSLPMPTLIVNGEHDTPQRLRFGAALHAMLPAAEREIIAHAGHLAGLDNPEQYNTTLVRFLGRHLADRP